MPDSPPTFRLPVALFLLGPAGAGKSTVAEAFLVDRSVRGQSWCLIDKDTVGEVLVPELLRLQGLAPADRDSPAYMRLVRDLEYRACLRLAAHQLRLGVSVALPAPWGRETASGALFDAAALGFSPCRLRHAYLNLEDSALHARIAQRAAPRDVWKLANWQTFAENTRRGLEAANRYAVPMLDASAPVATLVRALETLVLDEETAARPR